MTKFIDPLSLLTVTDVMQLLKISRSSVISMVRTGELPAQRVGIRNVRFYRKDVQALIKPSEERGKKPQK